MQGGNLGLILSKSGNSNYTKQDGNYTKKENDYINIYISNMIVHI